VSEGTLEPTILFVDAPVTKVAELTAAPSVVKYRLAALSDPTLDTVSKVDVLYVTTVVGNKAANVVKLAFDDDISVTDVIVVGRPYQVLVRMQPVTYNKINLPR
jgi:hypothetical protein